MFTYIFVVHYVHSKQLFLLNHESQLNTIVGTNFLSSDLIASAILMSSWILVWRHLWPIRKSTCVRIILTTSRIIENKRKLVILWQNITILGASELLVLDMCQRLRFWVQLTKWRRLVKWRQNNTSKYRVF